MKYVIEWDSLLTGTEVIDVPAGGLGSSEDQAELEFYRRFETGELTGIIGDDTNISSVFTIKEYRKEYHNVNDLIM